MDNFASNLKEETFPEAFPEIFYLSRIFYLLFETKIYAIWKAYTK